MSRRTGWLDAWETPAAVESPVPGFGMLPSSPGPMSMGEHRAWVMAQSEAQDRAERLAARESERARRDEIRDKIDNLESLAAVGVLTPKTHADVMRDASAAMDYTDWVNERQDRDRPKLLERAMYRWEDATALATSDAIRTRQALADRVTGRDRLTRASRRARRP